METAASDLDHPLPRARRRGSGLLWLAPVLVVFGLFYAVPLVRMVYASVNGASVSLVNYQHLVEEDVYATVFLITLRVALLVTVASLAIGYPVAYFLSKLRGRSLMVALTFVLLPFWTSVLVRNYAWFVLLARRGVVNSTLMGLGVIDQPLPLMFNMIGVTIGMTYVLVPFMILSLFSVMRNIDPAHLRASASLGASDFQTFWRIFLPQSLPGVYAGSLLVFITSIGFYITPALLGGGRVPMMATLIESQVRDVLNFGMGSALGTALLVAVLAMYYALDRVLGVEHLFGGRQ
ncbi:MAG: ABC transporter permease [Acidobacteriota bacterium]